MQTDRDKGRNTKEQRQRERRGTGRGGKHLLTPTLHKQNKNNVQAASPRPHKRAHGLLFLLFLPLAYSLSLSLFAFDQQRDHQPVDSRQKPTIPPENGRKKVGKKTDKPRPMHTRKCIVSKWCNAQLVNGRFLSLASTPCVCVCVCVCGGWGFYQGISRVFYFHFGNKAVSQTDR